MKQEEKWMEQLASHTTKAPEDLADRVMDELAVRRQAAIRRRSFFWPQDAQWIPPAFAGALATLLVVFGLQYLHPTNLPSKSAPAEQLRTAATTIHFELHAPGADRVELVGSFNDWKPGNIVLQGPDASGHWTADLTLPEGRYEYGFLVDGERWVADPKATIQRPDGFGRINTVIEVYENDHA
jgi:hypothetical protein